VEFFPKEEVLVEEVKIHRQPGHGRREPHEAGFCVPDICRELGISTATILQMERQIRRYGRLHDVPHE